MAKTVIERKIEIDDIGHVRFRKSLRGRNLTISVRPLKGVFVTVPEFVSFEDARKFVLKKKGWIKKQQVKIAGLESGITLFDISTPFKTREHILRLQTHDKASIKTVITKAFINVYYPGYADVRDIRIQRTIRQAIVETWRLEAKKILPPLVDSLACKYGFRYNKVTVRNNKTRWGSCSKDNNISLNLHLVRLPSHLREYIVLHELAHTVYKHHGKQFWDLLDTLTGKARMLDKELTKYKIEVW